MGIFAILVFLFWAVLIAAWLHGIILTFRASVILGIVCLFLHVPYVLVGVIYWFTGINLAQKLVDALRTL